MKKILLIFLAFILLIPTINAETKDLQKEGEYLRKNLKDSRYQYEDENDIKYGPFSNYLRYDENMSLDIPYYDYEIDKVYTYHKLYNIKTIQFVTVSGSFSYQNLKIYDDETEVEYTIADCSQCRDNNSYIEEGGYLTINLKRNINPENLTVNIEVTNADETPYVLVRFYRDSITSNPVLKTTFYTQNTSFPFNESWSQYQFDSTKEYYSKEKINSPRTYEEAGIQDVYRYREIYTFHYNLVANETENINEPIKEENNQEETFKAEIEHEPTYNSNENYQVNSIDKDQKDLINLDDYEYIEIPNTKKNDFFYTIQVIISKLLSITFFS